MLRTERAGNVSGRQPAEPKGLPCDGFTSLQLRSCISWPYPSVCAFCCCCLFSSNLESVSLYSWLAWKPSCSLGWPSTHWQSVLLPQPLLCWQVRATIYISLFIHAPSIWVEKPIVKLANIHVEHGWMEMGVLTTKPSEIHRVRVEKEVGIDYTEDTKMENLPSRN